MGQDFAVRLYSREFTHKTNRRNLDWRQHALCAKVHSVGKMDADILLESYMTLSSLG